MRNRFVGIDVGAESLKVVELVREGDRLVWGRRVCQDHDKAPRALLLRVLEEWDWAGVAGAAVTGRLAEGVLLERVPIKEALARGFGFLGGAPPVTLVSIGARGFSVLELRGGGVELFRENSRCSQGTGNFLRQLVQRFNFTIEQASELVVDVADPALLSGRCPVILKTDMTHLANRGEDPRRVLAGLFDAIADSVQALINPRTSPPRVALVGGVTRAARIRQRFEKRLGEQGMTLLPYDPEAARFSEALGCALLAAERAQAPPPLTGLLEPPAPAEFERVPSLNEARARVRRLIAAPPHGNGKVGPLILGFDIGSTGSKLVALDAARGAPVWQGYLNTNGDPVGAARNLAIRFLEEGRMLPAPVAAGVTGSGREIVGSLLATCYGSERVFILNEIAAHAAGALHFDPRVDTIFEIGGQDAKYIRLAGGRVVEAAMNEACSAGTGSFIEEQGRRFAGIRDVVHLGEEALGAAGGVSLGQHCSVFMAEVIDQAVAAGLSQAAIIAGLYTSIVQNYLNRVKGNRAVGQVVFCQGMPFCSDALAAAVARETGSEIVVPPNPGTVGALGIALLAARELDLAAAAPMELARFVRAEVIGKDTFICRATVGCGGTGNLCRIERLRTRVEGQTKPFIWGGGCSLHDSGTRTRKLPPGAPDPFRERQEWIAALVKRCRAGAGAGRPRVALTNEFLLQGLFPFFATYFTQLGLDISVPESAGPDVLKRGAQEATVPFCAPMQLYHGLAGQMAEGQPDFLFLPMLRGMPRVAGEPRATLCPIVQASPDIVRWILPETTGTRLLTPVLDIDEENLDSARFGAACEGIAAELGAAPGAWHPAFAAAQAAQREYDDWLVAAGARALEFCREHGVVPVVVLGRSYTIYNRVLNSNVPPLLREQGAMAIPVDCYPVAPEIPIFPDIYWSYGQRNLRAAYQIRQTHGVYGIWCSNYACGPDSFGLHFLACIMEGKPFAVIETDGHSGDAGTKTRIEAFLYCVKEDLAPAAAGPAAAPARADAVELLRREKDTLAEVRRRQDRLLIPRMGQAAEVMAAALRGQGFRAECLPMPDHAALRLGRRQTSGKECLPLAITLGSLLQRVERDDSDGERYAFFMPASGGPCRFGVYNILQRLALHRLGLSDRVRPISPTDRDYLEGLSPGFTALVYAGCVAADVLYAAYLDVKPLEREPGAALPLFEEAMRELVAHTEARARGDLEIASVLWQAGSGQMFGMAGLVRRAARRLAKARRPGTAPAVAVVGEIYLRMDPFGNDFLVDKLSAMGLRVRLAPTYEWIEYIDYLARAKRLRPGLGPRISSFVQERIRDRIYGVAAELLDWPARSTVPEALKAAEPYLRWEMEGEAVLTLGEGIHEWRHQQIDGVISVGPLECMPNKIAEAQYFHVLAREGLPSLTLSLNGEPLDPAPLESFVFQVRRRFAAREAARARPAEVG